MDAKELARTACRIFGHIWERPKYHAGHEPFEGKFIIVRVRTCRRCGQVEEIQK